MAMALTLAAKVGDASIENARNERGDFSPAISTAAKPSSRYSGVGVRGVAGPYDEMELRPSMDESLSLSRSLMNLALELRLSKLSASDTSPSRSSTTMVRISMFCFLDCQPCIDFCLASSPSESPSIDVALEAGRCEFRALLLMERRRAGIGVFPFVAERRNWIDDEAWNMLSICL